MAYPCNTTSINVVSLSLACSGIALLMAIFLTKKVNMTRNINLILSLRLRVQLSLQDVYIDT